MTGLDWLKNLFTSGQYNWNPVVQAEDYGNAINGVGGSGSQVPTGGYHFRGSQPDPYATTHYDYPPLQGTGGESPMDRVYNQNEGNAQAQNVGNIKQQEDWATYMRTHPDYKPQGDTTTTPAVDPLAMTRYEEAQIGLARDRFAWEQQQAAAAAQAKQTLDQGNAFDNYGKTVLSYADHNPVTGATVNAGFLPGDGSYTMQRNPATVNPLMTGYYAQHPELGPMPGSSTTNLPVGYMGAQALSGDQQHLLIPGRTQMGVQPPAGSTGQMGQVGINLPSYLYGMRNADGTPAPMGPQDAAKYASDPGMKAGVNDYVGHYAGFDPSAYAADSVGLGGTAGGVKPPLTFSGVGGQG